MKTVSRTLQLVLAVLVIVVGLSAASVRVLFPTADRYRGDLETWLAGIAGRPVDIGSLEAEWRGWRPEFRIHDLRLRDPAQRGKDGGVNARFESATVTVDVLASLLGGALRPTHIHLDDVSLRINEASEAADTNAAIRQHVVALLRWLQAQHRLRLDATRVVLSDLRVAGEPVTVANLQLQVRNGGPTHVYEVAADLPGSRDGNLRARAAVQGDATGGGWSGDIALDVDGLDLATIQAWRYRLGKTRVAGRAGLHLESRWEAGTLTSADGRLRLDDLRIAGDAGSLGPLDASALLDVSGAGGDWRLRLLEPGNGLPGFRTPTPLASLRYRGTPGDPHARVEARIARLDLAHLLPLLPLAVTLPGERWQQLVSAAPSGELRDVVLGFSRDDAAVRDLDLSGHFEHVALRESAGLPALEDAAGDFQHDAHGTRVRFAGGGLRAALPDLFPETLRGEQLEGTLAWTGEADERRLTLTDFGFVTPDVRAAASGELVWRGDDAVPFVDLSLAFRDGDLARLEYFVPTMSFGNKIGAWLNQAFPRGRITSGRVTLRGRPPKELMPDSPLEVTVDAQVEDTTVHYLDGWPSTERVKGRVHIADRRLVADVDQAYFYAARVRPGRFVVADILADDPVFEWQPRIDGRTEDAIRFLRESPLRAGFRSLLDNVRAAGKATLALDFRLPLVSGKPQLDGTLDVAGNTISVPSLARGFTRVAGRVRFDQDGMSGKGVTGDYLGHRVSADIETLAERSGHTRVRITGSADADYVARHLHNAGLLAAPDPGAMPILTRLEGSAPWEATIDVLEHTRPGEAPVVLRVKSNLRGARVTLPAPFNKSAASSMPLSVEARFADAEHRRMHMSLASLASGVFELRAHGDGYRMERGAVHLGGGVARLPDEAELSVSGRVSRAAMGEWSGLALKPAAAGAAGDALPTSVDLRIDALEMLDARFADVRVQADGRTDGSWRASISGADLEGTVSLPPGGLERPLVADFKRLAVDPAPGSGGAADATDPRNLPPLRLTCMQCRYGELELQDLEVITSRRADGLAIDTLRVRNDGFQARASGAWTRTATGAQRTSLDVRLSSDDLGKFLTALGHKGGATRGGVTDITLAASWDGPPSDFNLQAMDGVLHFRAGEGTLTDVRRGTTGRLLGLLVVPDLPRRLQGDFSDLFEDGFVYKQIEGTFNIERGNAYTNDLTLDGSLARISIAGRTGLADEDYDQLMTVTPKLSQSLPLMPIWLVEKALQRELFNKLFSYQYTITGSWDAPSVTPVSIEKRYPADRS